MDVRDIIETHGYCGLLGHITQFGIKDTLMSDSGLSPCACPLHGVWLRPFVHCMETNSVMLLIAHCIESDPEWSLTLCYSPLQGVRRWFSPLHGVWLCDVTNWMDYDSVMLSTAWGCLLHKVWHFNVIHCMKSDSMMLPLHRFWPSDATHCTESDSVISLLHEIWLCPVAYGMESDSVMLLSAWSLTDFTHYKESDFAMSARTLALWHHSLHWG
jgi:hypothetical protein